MGLHEEPVANAMAAARRTVACLAFFPTGFYLGVVHSEGLFLLTSVGAFWCARRGADLTSGSGRRAGLLPEAGRAVWGNVYHL